MKVFNAFLKWLALLVFSISAALLVIILLAPQPSMDYFWLRLSMLAVVAFIGGLLARLLFRRWHGVFLFLIALVTEVLALLVVDHFYESPYRFSFLTHALTFQMPAVSDGAQGVFMLIISLPTLFFLRCSRKASKVEKPAKASRAQQSSAAAPAPKPVQRTQAAKPQISLSQRVQPVLNSLNPGNWQVTETVTQKVKSITAPKPKRSSTAKAVHINAAPAALNSTPAPVVIKSPTKTAKKKNGTINAAKPSRSKRKQLNDVKLMGEEEHVCPYCLEKVDKSEEIVVCPECGTWHHKDCWDLTGSCGVAHRNEL
jgi:ribosomal protein L37AE/L43A